MNTVLLNFAALAIDAFLIPDFFALSDDLGRLSWIRDTILLLSVAASIVLHMAESLITPPERYPDLHVMLRMMVCAAGLCFVFAHSVLNQWRECFDSEAKVKTQ